MLAVHATRADLIASERRVLAAIAHSEERIIMTTLDDALALDQEIAVGVATLITRYDAIIAELQAEAPDQAKIDSLNADLAQTKANVEAALNPVATTPPVDTPPADTPPADTPPVETPPAATFVAKIADETFDQYAVRVAEWNTNAANADAQIVPLDEADWDALPVS